ncbi:shikimate dehydrogenase [Buchnera aphidicola]|uniref:Shikimate dehydrogenase (NADP(+)) n=1 Tax=Buchnera aphidicola str. Ua (Uroleucon ambrosiae) TaxID=1005057 RepID=G2LPX5_BUCUM|nr:shikimate dehydrogenase [Buchnera aphidicola]AEO08262.1 shikimate 5-dehydrogenase [Buchnera aphidicola str. Ua (Uroleucon ambrosiae)]
MFKCQDFNYAVFGNPINHTQSPIIHKYFSVQTNILHTYQAVYVPLDSLYSFLSFFFKNNGVGANITAPFKKEAYFFCNKLTEQAKIAQSVNTLKKLKNQDILGDNTDGIGLLSDLIRLNFIKKKYSILILGAGGAVQGILFALLSFGCSIFILNRTVLNAEKIVTQFQKYGNIQVLKKNELKIKYFDLVINARSKISETNNDIIPLSLLCLKKTHFYDINYQKNNTKFIDWCISIGAHFVSNGIGMLAFQAAHAFFLWHNVMPKIHYIIDILRKTYSVEKKRV